MGSDNSRLTLGELARTIILVLTAFLLTAALLHLAVGDGMALYGAERTEKLVILDRSRDTFSTAAFGSSHVHQGFDPRAFDAALAGTSLPQHSINLAIDGGAQVEQRLMARYYLDHLKPPPTPQPCFVLLEANAPPTFSLLFATHPRHINILDWQSARLARHFAWPPSSRLRNLHVAFVNYAAAFYNFINLGMLSNRIFRPPLNEALIASQTEDDRRGMFSEPDNQWFRTDVQNSFARRLPVPQSVPASLESGHTLLIEDLHHAPNGDRLQFAWIVTPGLDDLMRYRVFPASQTTSFGEVPIFNLARPDLYPQLYDPSLWLDNQHLKPAGAQLASQILAHLLLTWSQSHPITTRCGG